MSDYNPALTAQEWAAIQAQGVDWSGYKMTRQQIAALALHGQPFGFTREDVENIREVCFIVSAEFDNGSERDSRSKALLSLAARIEALLPPLSGPEETK